MFRLTYTFLGLCFLIGLPTVANSQNLNEQSKRLKYHDPNSVASHAGGIELSLPRLFKLDPTVAPPSKSSGDATTPNNDKSLSEKKQAHFLANLKEHLEAGDSRAAVVISTEPLLVAAYNDDLDCVAMLKFPSWLVKEYDLKSGSRLLTINTFFANGNDAKDLHYGPKKIDPYKNVYPVIADFVTEDKEQLIERKSTISETEWERCTKLAKEYREHYPKSMRNGVPSQSFIPSNTPESDDNETKTELSEKKSK